MSKAKAELKPLPKRFYKRVAFDPVNEGYVITLDGKIIRTPQQKLLHCASQQLAQQIAAEWEAQVDAINTDAMPLTRLLNIALDRTALDRAALLAEIANYTETDLLFYRAPSAAVIAVCEAIPGSPGIRSDAFFTDSEWSALREIPGRARDDGMTPAEKLAALQLQHFAPILQWCSATYGAQFNLTEGLMPIAQPQASLQNIAAAFAAANDHELAALSMMVPILGSALLTLAIWQGALDVEAALIAARLDESVQAKQWGEDAEVAAKWAAKCRDVRACAFFLTAK